MIKAILIALFVCLVLYAFGIICVVITHVLLNELLKDEKKSLDDVAKEVTKDKDAAISFLKSTGIMNENGELADEYK